MSWIENLHSANWNQAGALCLFAYVLGCFTSGYYLVRLFADADIREIGSGSVGARNAGRVLGKPGFLTTVFFDFGKGALAVWTAKHFTSEDSVLALVMLSVVAGHIWPAQLRFHGGKGMATSLGALVVYDPKLALIFAVLAFCLMAVMRRTVMPAMMAMATLPVAALLLGDSPTKVFLVTALSALVLAAHRKNLMEDLTQLLARRQLDPKPDRSEL